MDSKLRHTDGKTVCRNMTLTFEFNFGLDRPVPGGYKYGELVLQVGGVSDEKVIYGYESCATLTST
jgi:hypothetical protein